MEKEGFRSCHDPVKTGRGRGQWNIQVPRKHRSESGFGVPVYSDTELQLVNGYMVADARPRYGKH